MNEVGRDASPPGLTSVGSPGVDEELSDLHPAIDRFVAAVKVDVDAHLTDDVVEARLAGVRREAIARAKASSADRSGYLEELAAFGYSTVRTWLRIVQVSMQGVAAMGSHKIYLEVAEIEELAKDTAARAIIGFGQKTHTSRSKAKSAVDLKVTFLSHCIQKLPEAYRSRRLRLGQLGGELEELGQPPIGVQLVEALEHCVRARPEEAAVLLEGWTGSERDGREVIDLTRQALTLAAQADSAGSVSGADASAQREKGSGS